MANLLLRAIRRRAEEDPGRECYRFCWRKEGEWVSTSRMEFLTQTEVAGRAFAAMGLLEKDVVAVCSPNTPQVLITEFGAYRNRMAVIPIYPSSSQEQFDFIVSDGEAKVLFVGDKHQYPMAYHYWKAHPDQIVKIVVFKNDMLTLMPDDTVSIFWDDFVRMGMEASGEIRELVEQRTSEGLPDDLATLIYTSGTTGTPKGVCISHRNYDSQMESHNKLLHYIRPHDVSMAFLPMAHIFEKAWCFFCLFRGVPIAVNYDPRVIQDTIKEVRPNIMCCVPRFWEKVYAGVKEKLNSMTGVQRMAVARALKVGKRRNLDYVRKGAKVPRLLELEYKFWDKKLYTQLKEAIGIPDPNFFPTAGAALSERILEFMRSVGIDIVIGYGLSETTATVSCFRDTGWKIGTVGRPLPGIDVKISPEGEILVKADTVMAGYYKNPKANEEAFTDDGFFRTGDAGSLTIDGELILKERIKDLFKTSNGKYIAPQVLESRLAENKYIDEVAVIGDQRKFVSALVVPNMEQLDAWAKGEGLDVSDLRKLLADPKVNHFLMSQINDVQQDLAGFEKIKKITLLPEHFSMEKGELTNTLKVKRNVVSRHYAAQIDAMYEE